MSNRASNIAFDTIVGMHGSQITEKTLRITPLDSIDPI